MLGKKKRWVVGGDATAKGAGPAGTRDERELLAGSWAAVVFVLLPPSIFFCYTATAHVKVLFFVVVVCRKWLHDTQTFRERKAKRRVKGIPANDYSRGRDESRSKAKVVVSFSTLFIA